MEKTIYDVAGAEAGKIKLNDKLFGMEIRQGLIYDKIKNELANKRVGTASTKTRAEVRGGGKKPWRQKGTGRARHGSNRSPIWIGGGVVFGPKPRDYSYKLPVKFRRLAIATVLAYKFQEENVVKVVKSFTVDSAKTKDAYKIAKQLTEGKEERSLLIFLEDDANLKRAFKNIPWMKYMSAKRLAAHELYYAKHVFVMDSAVKYIEENYSNVVK